MRGDRLDAVIQGMGDGVVVIDESGAVLVFNQAARRILGLLPDQDLHDAEFVQADGTPIERSTHPLWRAVKGDALGPVELFLYTSNRELRHLSVTVSPATISKTQRGAVAVFRDVTRTAGRVEDPEPPGDALCRVIVTNLPSGAVFVFDAGLRVLAAHGAQLFDLAGHSSEELVGRDAATVAPAEMREQVAELYYEAIAGDSSLAEVVSQDRAYALHTAPIFDEAGAVVAALAMYYDVTEYRRDTAEVAALSAKMSTLIEHMSTGVLFEDPSGRVQFVNSAFCQILGQSDPSAVIGRALRDLPRMPAPADREAFHRLRQRRMDEGVIAHADHVELADGRILERDYVPVRVAGVAEGHFWCLRDVTERERASAQLSELSNRDALTGLYNRRGFMTLAEQWLRIAQRTFRAPLLLFIDVNGMKPINDRLGHATGDQVLRDAAELIRMTFRESDIMARLGGDEFGVLAVDASPERASLMSDRLQQNLRSFNAATPRAYRVSVSVGISIWDPAHPRSIEELLAEANAHMYASKRQRASNAPLRINPV
jgi:diguanylate cyclase (GGDEF)-like protein/PAS domain S-box-containing protein